MGLFDSVKEKLGFSKKLTDNKYTTNYDYNDFIPKPCTYYNDITKRCCDKNDKDCILCNQNMMRDNKCYYVMDTSTENRPRLYDDYLEDMNDAIDDENDQSIKQKLIKERDDFVKKYKGKNSWDEHSTEKYFDKVINTFITLKKYKNIILPPIKDKCPSKSKKLKCGELCKKMKRDEKSSPRLGSSYFIENGMTCLDSGGKPVKAYNYLNSLPTGNPDLADSMLDTFEKINLDQLIYSSENNLKNGVPPKCIYITKKVGTWNEGKCYKVSEGSEPTEDKQCVYQTKPIIKDISIIDGGGNVIEGYKNKESCKCNIILYLFFIGLFISLLIMNYYIF